MTETQRRILLTIIRHGGPLTYDEAALLTGQANKTVAQAANLPQAWPFINRHRRGQRVYLEAR